MEQVAVSGDAPVEEKAMVLRIEGSGRVSPERLTTGRVLPANVLTAAMQAINDANEAAKVAGVGSPPEAIVAVRLATGDYYVGASSGDGATLTAILDEMCRQLGISR